MNRIVTDQKGSRFPLRVETKRNDWELNPGHQDLQSYALPTELPFHFFLVKFPFCIIPAQHSQRYVYKVSRLIVFLDAF